MLLYVLWSSLNLILQIIEKLSTPAFVYYYFFYFRIEIGKYTQQQKHEKKKNMRE